MKDIIKRKIKYTKIFQYYKYKNKISKNIKIYFDKEDKLLQYKDILNNIEIV